jgi:AcrR family transcriptional regulator
MPPKIKIAEKEIVNAALGLVRKFGESALNARMIAAELGCSTQPIFSNFATMEELKLAVVKRADRICQEYMRGEEEREDVCDVPAVPHGAVFQEDQGSARFGRTGQTDSDFRRI